MAWFECIGGNNTQIETASIFRWYYQSATTCWGILKKTDGTCIGQNGDNSTNDIVLDGNIITVLFHGNSQTITVTAKQSVTLKAYSTSRTYGTVNPVVYSLDTNESQSFNPDDVYGGLYLEAL